MNVICGTNNAGIGSDANPPTPWGHEACRWSLKPKPLPPLVSSHYPKLILRGEVYLSPPPLHWVVAPAFNICSDYSRSRNLMLSPRARLQILTFFIFKKVKKTLYFHTTSFFVEVSLTLKSLYFAMSTFLYNFAWNINTFWVFRCKIAPEHPKLQGEAK